MPQVQAKRRLVKSPPELWTELSDAAALARHLGELGEIRITRLEPETKVVWEGDRASGTVEIASSGWGTQVVLTVEVEDPGRETGDGAQFFTPDPEPEDREPARVGPQPDQEAEGVAAEPELVATAAEEPAPQPESIAPEHVAEAEEPAPEPEPIESEPRTLEHPAPRGFLARLFGRNRRVEHALESAQAAIRREAAAMEAEPGEVAFQSEPEPAATEPDAAATEPNPQPPATQPDAPTTEPGPEPVEAEPERAHAAVGPDPTPDAAAETEALLESVLDQLGQARHRPFSRA